MRSRVTYSRFAEKQLTKLPVHIKEALSIWAITIEKIGIHETRKVKGYHDEPLLGNRLGQRSVRLSRAYRAIYELSDEGDLILISVIEVNKHDY